MISRPYLSDFRSISYYIGKIISGVAALMIIPLITALLFGEFEPFFDFIIGGSITLMVGMLFILLGDHKGEIKWLHAMVVGATSWIIAMFLGAIPHYLSGHFISYLDACFDVMSGFTTTGLIVVQNIDHASMGFNMWRLLLTYIGGQGLVVMVLTFLVRGTAGAYMLYVGEGREEKLLPNVVQTSRAIWLISGIYLVVGTITFAVLTSLEGMHSLPRAIFHGLWLFMTSWSTGGFSPQSLGVIYYHSFIIELATLVFMILGSFNFILHYTIWTGNKREILKNIELASFVSTVVFMLVMLVYVITKLDIYSTAIAMFRRVGYVLISGHTGTGLANVYAQQFIANWGTPALVILIFAMSIGGSACSTCGGIKGLRVGLFFKGLIHEIRRLIMPENAVIYAKYHHIKDIGLSDRAVKMAAVIIICFIVIYFLGGLIGAMYGYPFIEALFESVSAASTTGLSTGITSALMPTGLKLYYIFAMWAGRLEFLSVFGLGAFIWSIFKGK